MAIMPLRQGEATMAVGRAEVRDRLGAHEMTDMRHVTAKGAETPLLLTRAKCGGKRRADKMWASGARIVGNICSNRKSRQRRREK